jgi:hypothetical protein
MPDGKPAGKRCIHLDLENMCQLFNDDRRPTVCEAFKAGMEFCGESFDSAMENLKRLEIETGA